MISGLQIRLARAALRWRVDDLSQKSGVPWARIQLMERNNAVIEDMDEKVKKIKDIFEKNGITFVNSDDINQSYILLKK